jgi:hypothetical protein
MSARYVPFAHATKLVWSGGVDYLDDTIKVALVASTYTLSLAHTVWADISTHEVSSGGGYTTGGATLTGKTLTNVGAFSSDVEWDPLDKQFRYAIFYKLGTGDGMNNPLLGVLDYGDVVTVNNVKFTAIIPSSGIAVFNQNVI